MYDFTTHEKWSRNTYTRKVSVLMATMNDDNEQETLDSIDQLTEERREWLKAWEEVQDVNDTHDDAFGLFVESFGMDLDTADDVCSAIEAFNASYIGYMSAEEYAENLTKDTTDVPEHLACYIDYEKMGRYMVLGGDVVEEDGHLFNANW